MDIHDGECHKRLVNAPVDLIQTSRAPVGSVVQAVAVLRYLAANRAGGGVTAIARAVGIGPSSCFNVLKTLVAEDLVAFDRITKVYTLGLGTIDLARQALSRDAVVEAAAAPMAELADYHDAAIGLWRLAPRERLVLVVLAESEAATRIHMVVGQRQPAAAGATGRAVLATRGLDDAAIRTAYAGLRWQNAPGEENYLAQVRAAERLGYATDIDQINRGIATVGAVVTDRQGKVRFVLSASTFAGRVPMAAIGRDLRDAAAKLSRIGNAGNET